MESCRVMEDELETHNANKELPNSKHLNQKNRLNNMVKSLPKDSEMNIE